MGALVLRFLGGFAARSGGEDATITYVFDGEGGVEDGVPYMDLFRHPVHPTQCQHSVH